MRGFSDCSIPGSVEEQDQCYAELAFKDHEPASCEPIQNDTLKTVCLIKAKALQADPSSCDGCTKPVGSVEDLLEVRP